MSDHFAEPVTCRLEEWHPELHELLAHYVVRPRDYYHGRIYGWVAEAFRGARARQDVEWIRSLQALADSAITRAPENPDLALSLLDFWWEPEFRWYRPLIDLRSIWRSGHLLEYSGEEAVQWSLYLSSRMPRQHAREMLRELATKCRNAPEGSLQDSQTIWRAVEMLSTVGWSLCPQLTADLLRQALSSGCFSGEVLSDPAGDFDRRVSFMFVAALMSAAESSRTSRAAVRKLVALVSHWPVELTVSEMFDPPVPVSEDEKRGLSKLIPDRVATEGARIPREGRELVHRELQRLRRRVRRSCRHLRD